MLTRKAVVLAKKESTYGSDPTPDTSNDAIIVYDLEITPEVDTLERVDRGITLSRLKELGGKRRVNVNFTCELVGSGTAGASPKALGDLLECCGMSETLVAVTSATYAFLDSTFVGLTLWVYMDGIRFVVNGCVGNWEIVLNAGETPKIKFTLQGLFALPTDVTFPTSYTPNTTEPLALKNCTVTLESYAAVFRSIVLRSNNTITERPDIAATHGVRGFQITDRNPEAEITIEAVLLATNNFWNNIDADTVAALSIAFGSGAGKVWTLAAPYFRVRELPVADEDGILVHPLTGQMSRSSAKDEFTMVNT